MQNQTATAGIPSREYIKQQHLKQIFLLAMDSDGISRAQLRQKLRLSFPSVSALVDTLLADGILTEDGTVETAPRGRPRSLLRVNPEIFRVPVAEMTSEGYRCVLFNSAGQLEQQCFLPFAGSPSEEDMRWLEKPLQDWLEPIRARYSIPALLLIASGNTTEKGALSSSAHKLSTPEGFLSHLQANLALPVCLYNNADCFAYGEKFYQALPEDFVFLIVSQGVGAGIIRKGETFRGGTFRAGEIGHISIDYRGRPCSCGNRGCLEQYISLTCITQEACALLGWQETPDSFSRICCRYQQGDPLLTAMLEEKAQLLALGISNTLALQPVNHVVIGGGIEQLGTPFLEALRRHIRKNRLRKYIDQFTVSYTCGNADSGLLGAFRNYLEHSFHLEALSPEDL